MESNVSVLKFGGTSVGSGERIRHVAHIIAHAVNDPVAPRFIEGARFIVGVFPVVVVSAMSGVTDQLLRIAHYASTNQHEAWEHELSRLKQRHIEAAEKAVHDQEDRQALRSCLETAFTALDQDIASLEAQSVESGQGQEVPLLTTAIAAWGERLSVLLLAAAVRDVGVQATPVREEVIITSHPQLEVLQPSGGVVSADPLPDQTWANAQVLIHPLMKRGVVPIVAGFIARTTTGFVITLGRNGSDYSATVIGAALDCAEVSIYTDVDGVRTADPRVVVNTRLLPELSYAEAARLSWFGAKVLHPRTLIPVAHRGIPVRVRSTFRPHSRGTLIGPEGIGRSGAAAITIRRRLALITVESTDMFGAPENAAQVFALAARAGAAPIAICSSSGHHLSFLVEEQTSDSVVALLQHDLSNWRVLCRCGLAACACIGSGFTADPMSPARAITALARERIPIVTQGASELGITLIVEDQDSERALRCLHRDLIAPVIPLVRHSTQKEETRSAVGVQ